MRRASIVVLALATLACADRTALLVEVSSPDLAIPADVDALRIRAWTPLDATFDQAYPVSTGWPHSITILPAPGEGIGQVFVEVTGTRDGDFVVRRVVLTTFEPGTTRRVSVSLLRSCVGVMCPEAVDCSAGTCMGVAPDAGVDAGSDAGELDAARGPDTGVDAGLDDGSVDGGLDASVDAGVDAAMDAGVDGGLRDAGIDAGMDAGTDTGPRDTGTDVGIDAAPSDAGPDCTGIACLGAVVISELATAGTGSALDEFIELYNRGSGTATIGGCVLAYHSATGVTRTVRATIPAGVTIASHRYYLLASGSYAGVPAADFVWPGTTGSADPGGTITLECSGTPLDRIGYGTATLAETAPITPTMLSGGSYERKANASSTAASMSSGADVVAGNAQDTDHNELDLVVRSARDPQSSASAAEP